MARDGRLAGPGGFARHLDRRGKDLGREVRDLRDAKRQGVAVTVLGAGLELDHDRVCEDIVGPEVPIPPNPLAEVGAKGLGLGFRFVTDPETAGSQVNFLKMKADSFGARRAKREMPDALSVAGDLPAALELLNLAMDTDRLVVGASLDEVGLGQFRLFFVRQG